MNKTDFSRRDFLKITTSALLSISGLLGMGGLLRFLDYQPEPGPKSEYDLGPAAKYPAGSRTVLPEIPAVLLHSANGFSALSLVCPHLGCTVQQKPDGFTCPCHGSRYDPEGRLLRGPAKKPLAALRLEQGSDGHLILHLD